MAALWFCKAGEKEVGPYSTRQLKALADAGKLSRQTPVRGNDSTEWSTAGQVSGVFPPMATPLVEAAAPASAAAAKPIAKVAPPRGAPAVASATPPRGVAVTSAGGAVTPAGGTAMHDTARVPHPPTLPIGVVATGPVISTNPVLRGGPSGGHAPGGDDENPLSKQLAIAAIAAGMIGIGLCIVPYAAIAVGAIGVVLGVACFLLPKIGQSAQMMAIGGAVAGLAAVGAGGYMMSQQKNAEELAAIQAAKQAKADDAPIATPDEAALDAKAAAKRQALEAAAATAPATSPASTAGSGASPAAPQSAAPQRPANDPQRKFVESVTRWSNAPSSLKLTNRQVRAAAVWFVANPANPLEEAAASPPAAPENESPLPGEGDPPANPEAETTNDDPEGAASESAIAPPPDLKTAAGYVCVEIQISNVGKDAPWNYSGWGGPTGQGRNAALLIDSAGNITPLVAEHALAPSSTAKVRAINPGEMVSVGLVFAAPADAANGFRIALPPGAIGARTPMGFEFSPKIIAAGRAGNKPPVAVRPPARPEPMGEDGDDPPPLVFKTEENVPPAVAPPAEPGDKPAPMEEVIPDIRKQIEDARKRDEEQRKAQEASGKGEK